VNNKLQEYLNTLSEADRAKVMKLLGPYAESVVEEDRMISAAREAAGLPKAPIKTTDPGDAARKAAGLPEGK
jgi:hypothetical protein